MLIVIGLGAMAILLVFMGLADQTAGSVAPHGGVWQGDKVQFFVAEDGTKITTIKSCLAEGMTFRIGVPSLNNPQKIFNFHGAVIISIENSCFNFYDDDGNTFTGKFNSPFSAEGHAVYHGEGDELAVCFWTARLNPDAINENRNYESTAVDIRPSWQHQTFSKPPGPLAFTPDLKYFVTVEIPIEAAVVEVPSGVYALKFSRPISCDIYGRVYEWRVLGVSPDGRTVAVIGIPGCVIFLWELSSGKELLDIKGCGYVKVCCFTPDGKRFILKNQEGTIEVWDIETRRQVQTFNGYGVSTHFRVAADGKQLLSDGDYNELIVWDLASGEPVKALPVPGPVTSIAYHSILQMVAVASVTPKIQIIHSDSGETIATLAGHRHFVRAVAFTPDGNYLVSGSDDGTLRVWDLKRAVLLKTITVWGSAVFDILVNADRNTVVTALADGRILFWDLSALLQ